LGQKSPPQTEEARQPRREAAGVLDVPRGLRQLVGRREDLSGVQGGHEFAAGTATGDQYVRD